MKIRQWDDNQDIVETGDDSSQDSYDTDSDSGGSSTEG